MRYRVFLFSLKKIIARRNNHIRCVFWGVYLANSSWLAHFEWSAGTGEYFISFEGFSNYVFFSFYYQPIFSFQHFPIASSSLSILTPASSFFPSINFGSIKPVKFYLWRSPNSLESIKSKTFTSLSSGYNTLLLNRKISLVRTCTFLRMGQNLFTEVEYFMLIVFKLVHETFSFNIC